MISASDAALILVSGERENPKYPFQRFRARMMVKNWLMFATSDAGGRPTKARSKCSRGQLVMADENGRTRSGLGLSALRRVDVVAVHDGARPLITADGIAACIELAKDGTSVIAGGPAVDTIKVVDDREFIQATPERATLRVVATPQVFPAATLRRAHEAARRDGVLATDDAALVERLGESVLVHDLGAPNPKITSPQDLRIAEALLDAGHDVRTGIGIDSHRFAEGRRLVLGGVAIPSEVGLDGHSDADVLTHAIIDALLGAAGLGDIGAQFGTADPQWKDGNSTLMLRAAVSMLAEAGARPQSVDATVIAERPRLRPHIETMRALLAEALQLDISAVNVAATTAEGMGALGRAEGIATHAVATVRMRRSRSLRRWRGVRRGRIGCSHAAATHL